jgi:hypothetical protein
VHDGSLLSADCITQNVTCILPNEEAGGFNSYLPGASRAQETTLSERMQSQVEFEGMSQVPK